MASFIKKQWQENKGFILFIALMVLFRSAIADWNEVPTGSMKPTIVEGDRIWVNKLAYDFRIPFEGTSLIKFSDPQRGDIVVFESAVSDKRLVKRVIGVPGDVISMQNNELTINGKGLSYQVTDEGEEHTDLNENLLGINHSVRVTKNALSLDSFSSIIVPEGNYMVLGDNRDNSADSRVIGFVPREEIIGRARHVVLSFNYDNYYIPRSDRFFYKL